MGTQREDSHLQAKEEGVGRNQLCWRLDLRLLTSRTEKINFYCVSPPVCGTSLWWPQWTNALSFSDMPSSDIARPPWCQKCLSPSHSYRSKCNVPFQKCFSWPQIECSSLLSTASRSTCVVPLLCSAQLSAYSSLIHILWVPKSCLFVCCHSPKV